METIIIFAILVAAAGLVISKVYTTIASKEESGCGCSGCTGCSKDKSSLCG